MEILTIITGAFYMASVVGYIGFLFFQKRNPELIACFLYFAGFLCHTGLISYSAVKLGRFPAHNLHETLVFASWAVSGVFLLFRYKFKLKILGVFAAPVSFLVLVAASLLPGVTPDAKNLFNNFWLISHIVTIFMGDASFALACGLGILYLIQERAIKGKRRGFFFSRLPSLDQLDTAGYACLAFGFTLLSLGLITGLVYAKMVWGRFWTWDPKEVWSGITWLIYALLLHERLTVGWRGRRSAILAIIGFAALLFTFLGVNFFLDGHHGKFTQF